MTLYNEPGLPYNAHLGYNGLPPIVTAEELPTLALFVTDKLGNEGALPEAMIDQMSFENSAPSAISFTAIPGTVGYGLLNNYSIVELRMNGVPIKDGRWLLRLSNGNDAVPGQQKTFGGRHLLWDRLERTKVWKNKRYNYAGKTVGFILNDLFQEASNRNVGYWSNFTWSFDQGVDSAGNSWPEIIDIEYLPTAKYSDIVTNLVDRGLIDISLDGDEIVVTTSDRSGRATGCLLVVGEDVTDAPYQGSADNITSHVLMLGDDGVTVERSNAVTAATYWREEDGISQGGTKDVGTLSVLGDVALSKGQAPRVQRTYELVMNHLRRWLPLRDYSVQDWVTVQGRVAETLRVKQIVLKQERGVWTGSLVLNDKFIENELRLAKKVEGIIGGATIAGSSQTATPNEQRDTGVPLAPGAPNLTFEQYQDDEGKTSVVMIADWPDVTHNTDGSVANDLDLYRIAWRYGDQPATVRNVQYAEESRAVVNGIDLGRDVVAWAYVQDKAGNFSAMGPSTTANSGGDTIPPPQPSGPLLISRLKMLTMGWDGLDSTGQPMPPDFDYLEAAVGRFPGFDFEDGQLAGTMRQKGEIVFSLYGYGIGEIVYVKYRAVDKAGNKSPVSGENSNSIWGVFQGDLAASAVTANVIAAGAVGSQHVLAGALSAGRISLGPTMNLVQDPSFNDADMRTQRLTTKWCDKPSFWFFKDSTPWIVRNGYYLQALSQPSGENGGRMYVTDWINVQYGETYYFGIYAREGEFAPNAEARIFMGVEVTKTTGEIVSDGLTIDPATVWTKYGFNMPVGDTTWVKMRFFVRADNINAGDFVMDDWEVRSAVGTTANAGPRGQLTPEGLAAWNTSEVQTFLLDFNTGDLFARGQIVSGSEGKRIEVNPGSTFLPEIRFYGLEGESYAYINASSSVSTFPFIGVNGPDTGAPGSETGERVLLHDLGFQIGETRKSDGLIIGPGVEGINLGAAGYLYCYGKIGVAGALGSFSAFYQDASVGGTGATLILARPASPASGDWYPFYTVWRQSNNTFTHHMVSRTASTWNLLIAGAALGVSINTRIFQLHVRSDA
jgi:hypothetical protein